MEETQQRLIEKFLAGEASPAEQSMIQEMVHRDPQFKIELEQYTTAMEALKIAQREELRNRFRQRDIVLDRQDRSLNSGKNRTRWIIALAFVVMAFIAWNLRNLSPVMTEQPAPPPTELPEETTPITPNPDFATNVDNPEPEEKKIDPRRKPKNNNEELFAANFEPYMDESMEPTMRADEDTMEPLDRFNLHYAEKKFDAALTDFSQLSSSMQQNDNLQFRQAMALMATGKTKEASPVLDEIIQNGKSKYLAEAVYYRALIYLKEGRVSDATAYLNDYLGRPVIANMAKATQLRDMLTK